MTNTAGAWLTAFALLATGCVETVVVHEGIDAGALDGGSGGESGNGGEAGIEGDFDGGGEGGEADAGSDASCACSEGDECCDGCLAVDDGEACAEDGLDCTDDVCRQGECAHELRESFCLIDGSCYAEGDDNPENDCRYCDIVYDTGKWREKSKGASCNDGVFCNGADTCNSDGECKHAGDPCPDEDACNQCNEENDNCHSPAGTACDDSVFCNGPDACDGSGECEPAGDPCAAAGDTCYEDEDRCCTPDSHQGCNADGDVALYDSCDHEGAMVEDCDDDNGACTDGFCGCLPGLTGIDCDRCVIYVDSDSGSDGQAGDAWEQAKATIQAGINAAKPEGCEVWVAAGSYLPTEDASGDTTPANSRWKTFHLEPGVNVYGGFLSGEITRAQRDHEANTTLLSGDIGISDVFFDNVYHVVTGADSTTLDGFTITGGNADIRESDLGFGAGMFNDNVSPTVSNCVFKDNNAVYGGAIMNRESSTTIINCSFDGNSGSLSSGAIYNGDSSPTIVNCRFLNNAAYASGAIFSAYSNVTIINSVFRGNISSLNGGAVVNSSTNSTILNSVFEGNSSGTYGGAVVNTEGNVVIANSTFSTNSANDQAGAVSNLQTSMTINNSILWGNSPDEISSEDSSVSVVHSDVQGAGYDGSDGNISLDPVFVNADPDAASVDLHLQAGSPCIDAADDSLALLSDGEGLARYDDPSTDNCSDPGSGDTECDYYADMGAYEYGGTSSDADPICQGLQVWVEGDRVFRFCPGVTLTWAAADSYCRLYKMRLAVVRSQSENDFVQDLVAEDVWVGARQDPIDVEWRWVTFEPFSFGNWDTSNGEPDRGAAESCIVISHANGKWSDEACDERHFFVCESDG